MREFLRISATTGPRLSMQTAEHRTAPPYCDGLRAVGDGVVVVEIEMRRGEPGNYRIVGPASGCDAAALDAVRSWRFGPPEDSDVPDTTFAYALLGFRAPLTLPAERTR